MMEIFTMKKKKTQKKYPIPMHLWTIAIIEPILFYYQNQYLRH